MRLRIIASLFACICFVSYAQIEHPKPSVLETDKVFYLYNIDRKGFLVGGNKYDTQASIARSHAYKIILRKWNDAQGSWDGETYFLTDSVEAGDYRGDYLNVFIEKDSNVFVDQNALDSLNYHSTYGRDCLWTIKKKDSTEYVYTISPSKHNKVFNSPNLKLCATNTTASVLPVVGLHDALTNEGDEWSFVLPKNAEKYIKQRKYEKEYKKNEIMSKLLKQFQSIQVPTEDTVFLFNSTFEKFLIGENRYKSQASLSCDNAYKVVIHKYYDVNSQWDGKTYFVTDSVEAGNYAHRFRNLFIEKNGVVWVDQTEKTIYRDNLWEIIPSSHVKGAFNIRPAQQNKIFTCENFPNKWLGSIDFDARDYPVVSLVDGLGDSSATNWFILSKTEKDKVFEAFHRQLLQTLIFEVSDAFPQFDTSAVQAICENDKSSTIQIETAIGDLRLMLLSGLPQCTKETSFTSLLLNPDFTFPGGRGWHTAYDVQLGTITWFGGSFTNPCAEAWQSEYTFYQELRGLPKGLYRVNLQAYSRTRVADMAWIERDSSFVTPVIFANSMEIPVQNLMHTTFPNNVDYDFLQGSYGDNNASMLMMDGSFVLHNQKAASLAFAKGYFDQSVYCYVKDGSIKTGIKDEHKRIGAWTAWDNLRITYLPETTQNYNAAINCYLVKAREIERLAMIKGVDSQQLKTTISNAEALADNDDIGLLRQSLLQINEEMKRTRQLLALQEFGETEKIYYSYSQLSEEMDDEEEKQRKEKKSLKQDSINNIQDIAESYYHMGLMIENQNVELGMKHFQTSLNYYMSIPYDNQSEMDACVTSLSLHYAKQKQYEKVIEVWTNTIDHWKKSTMYKADEKLSKAYRALGHLYNFIIKNYSLAEDSYKNGLASAEKCYEEAVKSNNGNALDSSKKLLSECLNDFAYALAYQRKYTEAFQTIDRAIELLPEEPNYYDSKGEILYMSGDKEGARKMWDKVISLDPDFTKHADSTLYKYLFE